MTRQQIRVASRQARQQLSQAQQSAAAASLTDRFCSTLTYHRSQTIGLYLSFDGEISTSQLIERAWQDGKQVYLPVLPRTGRRMRFQLFTEQTELRPNKFGIWEPIRSAMRAPWSLDIVGMPLVAFDQHGNRMGMGGGFYDTTFALKQKHGFGPKLVGLAHEVQRQKNLPIEAWDVPLNAIITGERLYGRL